MPVLSQRTMLPQVSVLRRFAGTSSFLDRADVSARAIEVVKKFPSIDTEKVVPEAHFSNDLGLDSLDSVELIMAFEDEFSIEIPDEESEKIFTIDDAVAYISTHPFAK